MTGSQVAAGNNIIVVARRVNPASDPCAAGDRSEPIRIPVYDGRLPRLDGARVEQRISATEVYGSRYDNIRLPDKYPVVVIYLQRRRASSSDRLVFCRFPF